MPEVEVEAEAEVTEAEAGVEVTEVAEATKEEEEEEVMAAEVINKGMAATAGQDERCLSTFSISFTLISPM
ncbi:hypothetical protein D9758_015295 [Tetrapyrgos nigripes]|uniref:Uncharacterized protein n=1 Tax=Tetrapyrgos nigripes TaxID=182062 RepID=A0A8H5CPR1_9AGAR|nr:hypothetical protein D9758_015295 [Tetrapyrgos nigripes]